jgi:hypothetical protein
MKKLTHNVGDGKACSCGFIHVTNPRLERNGMWRCPVCLNLYPDDEGARRCAIDDHIKRLYPTR